ncbi:MAG: hypothetical protein QM680_14500 [Luteolibacter sp.]
MTVERPKPLWLYPNLLSLDAPLVAVAWLYIFSKTWGIWRLGYHPTLTYITLALVVWIIYVLDRLLDALMHGKDEVRMQARHEFHLRHKKKFLAGAGLAALVALGFGIFSIPMMIYSYLGVGILLVIGFFALSIFSNQPPGEISYAKNILAGSAFAYGTAMIAHMHSGFGGFLELLGSRELMCFAALCILNILAIDLWEHANRYRDLEITARDELKLTIPLTILAALSLMFALLDHEFTTRPFYYATLTGAALLQVLNRMRPRFSMEALRVLADLAILVPFLIFWGFPMD